MLKMFVIKWRSETGKVWESERYAASAMVALSAFRAGVKAMRNRPCITVIGIADIDGDLCINLVTEGMQ